MRYSPRASWLLVRVVGPRSGSDVIYMPETELLKSAVFEVLDVGQYVTDVKPRDKIIANLNDGASVITLDSDAGPMYLIPEEQAVCLVKE